MPKRKQKDPTITDVARLARVGSMTVSRVLNGGRYVSAEMEERVRNAISTLGYRPNEAARMLRGQAPRTIGLIVPNLADPFYSTCAHAAQQMALEHGYATMLLTCETDAMAEDRALELLNSRNVVSGILIFPSHVDSTEQLEAMQERGLPVVVLDRTIPGFDAGEVMVDNAGGAMKAVNHLIEHGHRRILCVGYDSQYSSIIERVDGYRKAMADADLKPQMMMVENEGEVQRALAKRLRGTTRPSALFALNNVTSIHCLHLLQRENIEVGREIAMAGFDDFDLADLLSVPLTAVRQPAAEIGRTGTRLLLDAMGSGAAANAKKLYSRMVLPTELIIRRSCGCGALPKIADENAVREAKATNF
jgi:LacI family transcriptional regulator